MSNPEKIPAAATPDTGAGEASAASSCSLTAAEVQMLKNALSAASSDIWQTARVSEYNLTGKDPNFPSDAPNLPPNPPMMIHRAGLDESYRVGEQVREALKMLYSKANAIADPRPTFNPDTE